MCVQATMDCSFEGLCESEEAVAVDEMMDRTVAVDDGIGRVPASTSATTLATVPEEVPVKAAMIDAAKLTFSAGGAPTNVRICLR